ncbi:MAG TPA: sugar phosphate isomerase/epimerase [Pseudonocardia sp.]|nr:sugar phosphate isomerase/epimerase [Pseudonocardia sp.]
MKVAVCTVSLPEWTPEQAVTELAALGADGVEWRVADDPPTDGPPGFWRGNRCTWPASSFERDVPRIAELTRAAGLDMPAIGPYARCDELDAVESLMRGAAALGVPRVRVQVGAPGPEGYRATFARRREEYRAVEELARRHGVQALVELHHQSLVASASAAARFVEGMDPRAVGVIHDVGNMLREGYEHDPWSLEILGEHLAHVHVKNGVLRPDPGASPPWTWGWAPMRTGAAPLERLFDALAGVAYDGWVSLEDFSTEAPLRERLRDGLDHVRALTART